MFSLLIGVCTLFQLAFAASDNTEDTPLIIVSLDGMDWRVLKDPTVNTTNLNYVAQTGVRAEYIKNVVPSETWPNHHTFLTGLYAESHGIVANRFWDPVFEEMFIFGYDCSNYDSKFYNNADPIWLSLQKQGGRSASYFWPASTSYPVKPTYYVKELCLLNCSAIESKKLPEYRNRTRQGWPPYFHCVFNLTVPFTDRIDKVIEWLQSDQPPQFTSLYIDQPDTAGHSHGRSSAQYKTSVETVDKTVVGYLLQRLRESDLLEKVNLIFVSDHGMENTSSSRRIYLDDFIDPSSYMVSSLGAMAHIWPHPGMADQIYQNLTQQQIPHVREVFKKAEIPNDYHWRNNRRIPPIFIDPEVGWLITRSRNDSYTGQGEHGWPPELSKSYSIFYARGPAFRQGFQVNPFNTVDVYPLMCKLLGIDPQPNNGSLDNVKAVLKEMPPTTGPHPSSGGDHVITQRFTRDLILLTAVAGLILVRH